MLRRKIEEEIEKWFKESTSALLIDGARQVGKTTSIENFLSVNGLDYIKFNLLENKLAKEAFDTSDNADQILLKLTALSTKELHEDTVIFIDEIQEALDAVTPIKFLVQKTKFRFIFSGSLLGVKMKDIASVPVGFLTILKLFPMDFEEFLWANNVSDKTTSYLFDCFKSKKKVDETIHKQMLNIFNVYLAVGGMPKAVFNYVISNDIRKVSEALRDIDSGYKKDIAKYEKEDKLQIEEIYGLIPSELNAQNKRFILKNMNEKARFYQCETSFAWIKNSGIGLFVHNVDNPTYPLLASKERTLFKLYLCDVGLLTFKLFKGNPIAVLNGNSCLNYGAIYEAVVAQELSAHGFDLYYHKDKKRGEIDFLIEDGDKVTPVEVKSGKDYKRHSALSNLMDDVSLKYENGYVFCNGNIERTGKVSYLPIYMIMFLKAEELPESCIIKPDISSLI